MKNRFNAICRHKKDAENCNRCNDVTSQFCEFTHVKQWSYLKTFYGNVIASSIHEQIKQII